MRKEPSLFLGYRMQTSKKIWRKLISAKNSNKTFVRLSENEVWKVSLQMDLSDSWYSLDRMFWMEIWNVTLLEYMCPRVQNGPRENRCHLTDGSIMLWIFYSASLRSMSLMSIGNRWHFVEWNLEDLHEMKSKYMNGLMRAPPCPCFFKLSFTL